MTFEKISLEIVDGVALLDLNDPQSLNAITFQMLEELSVAVDQAVSGARVLVLGGKGRAFCSGANLTESIEDALAGKLDTGSILETHLNPLMQKLRNLDIPWISVVHGGAAGAGSSLALAADMIFAAEEAYFLQAFVHVGLIPDSGAYWLMARTIGRARAMEMFLLGERITAEHAHRIGLVNRVCPQNDLQETAMETARKLAAGPAIAMGKIRQMTWDAMESSWIQMLEAERYGQRTMGETDDFREGVTAFLEKRRPEFTGT